MSKAQTRNALTQRSNQTVSKTTIITAYKGFDRDMKCRGYWYTLKAGKFVEV